MRQITIDQWRRQVYGRDLSPNAPTNPSPPSLRDQTLALADDLGFADVVRPWILSAGVRYDQRKTERILDLLQAAAAGLTVAGAAAEGTDDE